jgi:hypothetical protein
MIFALLTRPNGYSLLIFILIDFLYRHAIHKRNNIFPIFTVLILTFVFSLYLYPYFITELKRASSDMAFFGIKSSEYTAGLFGSLPQAIDTILSFGALGAAKILYFVGLRPTYGETSVELVILRAVSGVILLPGFLRIAFAGSNRVRLFTAIFFLPIFLGPSQDRYNLPIFPLLFLHGAVAWEKAWDCVRTKKARYIEPAAGRGATNGTPID